MDGSKSEFKVGLTVLLALAVLVSGLLWLKGYRLSSTRETVSVLFDNVGTLDVGDPVSVSGVTVGEVADIRLENGMVNVSLSMAREVDLRTDAVFTIKNIGLMGERFVDVRTGTAPDPLSREEPVIGSYNIGLSEVMGAMGRMTEEVHELVHAIRTSIGSDTTLAKLEHISASLDRITRETAGMISEHRDAVSRTVNNVETAASSLRRSIEAGEKRVSEMANMFDSAAVRLNTFAGRLDSLSVAMHTVVDELQGGEGTLPRLIHDDQLLRRWESTAMELDDLVADIRKNPGKYLKVKVSLF